MGLLPKRFTNRYGRTFRNHQPSLYGHLKDRQDPRLYGDCAIRPFGYGEVARMLSGARYLERGPNDRLRRFITPSWWEISIRLLPGKFLIREPRKPDAQLYIKRISDIPDQRSKPSSWIYLCPACEKRELIIEGYQEKREEDDPEGWEELVVFHDCFHVVGRDCFEKNYYDVQPDGSKNYYCPSCNIQDLYSNSVFHGRPWC